VPSSKRQREIARRRAERQAQRRAERERRRKRRQRIVVSVLTGVIVLALLLLGATTLFSKKKKDTVSAEPNPSASATAGGPCDFVAEDATKPKKKAPGLPPATPSTPGPAYVASFQLNGKPVTFTIDGGKAPCTAASFKHLASKKFFDNTPCHRLTTSGLFVLQCGDPTGTGSGGPGYTIPEENVPTPDASGQGSYPKGTVAMAKATPPHSTGSQFFLVYKDTLLPPDYTIVGRITSGLSAIETIAKQGATEGTDGPPKEKATITAFTVRAPAA
jgi:peptidyl-prolyl cis-trans isomerase B (cyclophilin B)